MNLKIKNKNFVIVKNFISDEEKNALNNWCYKNYNNNFFSDANMGVPGTRLTTRYAQDFNSFSFPEEAYKIQEKIINTFSINNFVYPPFKDGIVCGIGFNNGSIYEHVDPVYHHNTTTIHFNILSQKPYSGGNTYINNEIAKVEEGDLLCFKVSEDNHFVDTIVGNKSRILWVFGFCVLNDDVV